MPLCANTVMDQIHLSPPPLPNNKKGSWVRQSVCFNRLLFRLVNGVRFGDGRTKYLNTIPSAAERVCTSGPVDKQWSIVFGR